MGITVYSLFWVVQDLYHQPYFEGSRMVSLPGGLAVLGLDFS